VTLGYHIGDCLDLLEQMPDKSVHCVVTSPPYYALRSYLPEGHPDKDREIGSEPTLDAFLATMVRVFREVRRVLRDDGTIWVNIGDSYAGGAQGGTYNPETWKPLETKGSNTSWTTRQNRAQMDSAKAANLPPKNLLMVPARVAIALQADGWILRSDIIWSKPNPMPESCRDRPTNAHEHVFLFAKRPRYFYDGDAVRESHDDKAGPPERFGNVGKNGGYQGGDAPDDKTRVTIQLKPGARQYNPAGRNLRNVWTIATQPVKHKHYATFPEKLVEPCIKAGTSQEGVCAECGAPWERVVEVGETSTQARKDAGHPARYGDADGGQHQGHGSIKTDRPLEGGLGFVASRTTPGWRRTCECFDAPGRWERRDYSNPVKARAIVLDPFMGSGTVARVAERLGRDWVGFDLDERNRDMCELRLRRNQMELIL
jgi:DNA modification methylase